ncbi:MAG: Trk system potassium uptake protein TrkH [Chlamydiales bacterium]|nr:Trk system potassium uptake protein TrkH [Chlamydiales bacterium]
METNSTLPSQLTYSVRWLVLYKYLGLMLLAGIGALLVPFTLSLFWQEYTASFRYGIVIALFLALGIGSLKVHHPKSLQSNEVYAIVGLTFVMGSLALTIPMMGNGLSFIDSWFECVSGVTTTGLSVVDIGIFNNKTFFFSRTWMQWYGGLGIVIFSLGLASQPSTVSKALFKKVFYKEDLVANSRIFARKILLVYCGITLLGMIALKSMGLSFFDAVTFTFSAVSTGGFSSHQGSLSSFPYLVRSCVIACSFLGAISFPLFWISSFKDLKLLVQDRQLGTLIICCLVFSLFMFFLVAPHSLSFLPTAILNAVSMQTTAGFSTFDFSTLSDGAKFTSVISMFIGGSTQSTAGGFKLIRMLMIFKALHLLFFRTSLTKSANATHQFEQLRTEAYSCLTLLTLYIMVILISVFVFILMGYNFLDGLFEVVSATGNVGVSVGTISPELPSILKGVLIADMLLGRLELVTLLVLIYPKTFIGRRMTS